MTRLEALEKVLAAAEAVLEAREDQMLTNVEWDALAAAVKSAQPDAGPVRKPSVRIVFEDDLMLVMDDENQGYDCLDLDDCSLTEAQTQIDRWAGVYEFDLEAAKRDLAAYYPDL